MATVRVVVVDEDGNPQKGVTVAAYSLANFPNVVDRQISDSAGSALFTITEPVFFDAFNRRGVSMRERNYPGRIQVQIVSFGGLMNADYVVAHDGTGTHETLFGADGALQEALATGESKFIWLCTTHEETLSTTEALPAFALNQQIIVASGTRERAVISVTIPSTALAVTFTNGNGADSLLAFKSFRFSRVSGTGALLGPDGTSPAPIPDLELENMDFHDGGSTFDALVGGSLLAPFTTANLTVRGCTGDGALVIWQLGATSNGLGLFQMEDCRMTLQGINRHSSDTSVDWGMGGQGTIVRNNFFIHSSAVMFKQNYDAITWHFSNNIIHTSYNGILIRTGVVQTGSNIHITNNTSRHSTAGAQFLQLNSATSNVKNIMVSGNSLDGPGSGTAISTVFVNTGALPESIIIWPNSYRDWTTNFDGTAGGATDDITDVGTDGSVAFAPLAPDYLVGTTQAGLPNEIVAGTTPGGELSSSPSWAAPTVNATHSGTPHHNENHASRHAEGGADELNVADLGSTGASSGDVPTADGAGGIDWLAGGSGGGGGAAVIPFVIDAVPNTWTNMPAALTELFGATNHRTQIDFTDVTDVTFVVNVQTAGVAGSKLRVQYSLDESSWAYLDGVSGPSVAIDATGVEVATVTIEAAAQALVFLRVVGIDGDAAGDPVFGNILLIAGGASSGAAPIGAYYVVGEASGPLTNEIVKDYMQDNYDPIAYPGTPDALDDEFEGGGAIDGKWTLANDPGFTQTSFAGNLYIPIAASGAAPTQSNIPKLSQAPPSGSVTWEFRIKASMAYTTHGTNPGFAPQVGLYIRNSTNNQVLDIVIQGNNAVGTQRITTDQESGTGFTGAGGTASVITPGLPVILRMRKTTANAYTSANTYVTDYSFDGITWIRILSISKTFTTNPDEIGIMAMRPTAAVAGEAAVDFFRRVA